MSDDAIDCLVIEDDPILGGALEQRLRLERFGVRWVKTCAEARRALRAAAPDFVLADIRLPDGSGEDVYRDALPYLGNATIVFATAFAEVEQAVRLVRAGADDYLTKPVDIDALVERIRAVAPRHAKRSAGLPPTSTFALSPVTEAIGTQLRRVAHRDLPVLLRGETGVGKEVAARFIHLHSGRAKGPFVAVNCGAIPRELMESQFFGHERGAFTGAVAAHQGHFREAQGGTLFLDEIGELDARLQTALLRVLQDGTFRPVGSARDRLFDGRIVAATNADLEARVAAGQFRKDLYYRLATVEVLLPPLRDRPAEIEPLARLFIDEVAARAELPVPRVSADAVAALLAHEWPGNVRELRNRIERAMALGGGEELGPSDLFPERRLDENVPRTLADAREQAEIEQIERAIALSGGRLSEAAKRLGVSRTTLWKRRRKST